ncbi:MAG: ABC transporter substrate-binding protein [Dehalococcoidia bacterium]|nr:ABC transporter substrate-binding protein [Dehalococcoidia bacterium]
MQLNRRWMAGVAGTMLSLAILGAACSPAATPTSVPTKAPAAASPTQAPPAAATSAATAAPKPTAAATAQATPGKLTPVTFGSPGSTSDAGVYIAMEKGYFKDLGLDVQLVSFQSGALTIPPLSSGDLDVAGGTISTALFNAIDRGVALRIVAGKGSSTKGWEFTQEVVRKDLVDSGQYKTVKDLKGKKIACSSVKSGCEAKIDFFLRQGGLTINDIDFQALAYPDMLVAFSNKAIDGADLIEPTLGQAAQSGVIAKIPEGAPGAIYGGEYQAAELVFSEQFTKNTDAARRFIMGYIKGERDYNDAFGGKGINKAAIVSILIKYTAQKDAASYDKMEMPYLQPDGKMHVPSMQMDFDYFKRMGYYTGNTTLNSIINTSFLDYAAQQLGANN